MSDVVLTMWCPSCMKAVRSNHRFVECETRRPRPGSEPMWTPRPRFRYGPTGLRRVSARACLHQLDRLPVAARPYRYRCRLCGQRQKIANGIKRWLLEAGG
jgi:hypothetical protein